MKRSLRSVCVLAAVLWTIPSLAGGPRAADELQAAYEQKAQGHLAEAKAAFERARELGAGKQLVALELGYLASASGDPAEARRHWTDATHGNDPELAVKAQRELDALGAPQPAPEVAPPAPAPAPEVVAPPAAPAPTSGPAASSLAEAYRAKASGDLAGARAAFERAKSEGANGQMIAMELGYLALSTGDESAARTQFEAAERGADRDVSEQARRQRALLPKHLHADAYADAFGWRRVGGPSNGSAIVPMLRVRALYRPVLDVPLEMYVSAQGIRDTASHGFSGTALPQIYSDNYATFGGGLRLRIAKRIELFGQAGPALNLLDDGRDRVTVDIRGGAMAFAETQKCAPPLEKRVRANLWPCLEGYAEAIYVNRFNNDVSAFIRPRGGVGYLLTGPVLWQVMAEGRAAKDINGDYWNNFADVGAGHRWRLLAPMRLDLFVSANAGSYFGIHGRDPAPSQLTYVDARAIATTYVEF